MPTPYCWKGFLKLALVSVPVRAISSDAMDRGAEDFPDLYTEGTAAMVIREFIAPAALDPIYGNGATFYLLPDSLAAQRPYVVLRQAMTEQACHAIAQVVWHGRQRAALLRPMDRVIGVTLLSYEHEVIRPTLLENEVPRMDITPDEVELAKALINGNTARKFDFSKYQDIDGPQLITPEAPVGSLLDALKQSLAELPNAEQQQARPCKKMAPSKPSPAAAKKKKTS